jgi:rhomboid family GlyGly-CTERM serine protease
MTATAIGIRARGLRLSAWSLLGLAALALVLLDPPGHPLRALLMYTRASLEGGEVWRLLTAHVVHQDLRHALLNVGGLGLLWLLFRDVARARTWLLVAGITALSIDAGLYVAEPGVEWYLGASGVLHGVWAAGGIFTLGHARLEGAVTLGALLLKLILEQALGPLSGADEGLVVVTAAHAYGALGGLATSAWIARASLATGVMGMRGRRGSLA